MISLCSVCGTPATPTHPLTPRAGQEVCPDCLRLERRTDPETGIVIERRGTGYVNVTATLGATPLQPARVAGRRLDGSIADFEQASAILIAEEQEKLDANPMLIAVLADAIRLAREYVDAMAMRRRP